MKKVGKDEIIFRIGRLGKKWYLTQEEDGGACNMPCKDHKEVLFELIELYFKWLASPRR